MKLKADSKSLVRFVFLMYKVRSELEKNSGTQFDPEIAACMISIMDEDTEYKLHE